MRLVLDHVKLDGINMTDLVRGNGWSTLLASLSGTFLQTLPDLVRPLKGHF